MLVWQRTAVGANDVDERLVEVVARMHEGHEHVAGSSSAAAQCLADDRGRLSNVPRLVCPHAATIAALSLVPIPSSTGVVPVDDAAAPSRRSCSLGAVWDVTRGASRWVSTLSTWAICGSHRR